MTAVTATEPSTAPRKLLKKIRDDVNFFDHQIEDMRRGARMNSFILANPMGMGKSLTALGVVAIDFEMGYPHKTLIVAPASLKWNWEAEILEYTNFTYQILDGTPDQRAAQIEQFVNNDTDILIVGYEQVRLHLAELQGIEWGFRIFDEAHALKNPRSKRTEACLQVQSSRSIIVTGSPVLNHVDELWTPFHIIDSKRYPNYFKFLHRHVVFGGYKDKQKVGVKNQAQLVRYLQSVMIRRDKSILGLPGTQVIPVILGLHPLQQKLYRQAVNEMKIDLPDEPDPMEIENALTKATRLKQICGTAATIPGYEDVSTKLDRAVEMIEQIMDGAGPDGIEQEAPESVVVFTQFRPVLSCLEKRLTAKGIPSMVVHGGVEQKDRVPLVKYWGDEARAGRPTALLCMYQVAGVGLNMTAANKAICLDELYVPDLNTQAHDRLDRIGASKTKKVLVFQFLCRGTVENRIQQILKMKNRIIGSVVKADDYKSAVYQALREEEES